MNLVKSLTLSFAVLRRALGDTSICLKCKGRWIKLRAMSGIWWVLFLSQFPSFSYCRCNIVILDFEYLKWNELCNVWKYSTTTLCSENLLSWDGIMNVTLWGLFARWNAVEHWKSLLGMYSWLVGSVLAWISSCIFCVDHKHNAFFNVRWVKHVNVFVKDC